jgi:hypothetical protein
VSLPDEGPAAEFPIEFRKSTEGRPAGFFAYGLLTLGIATIFAIPTVFFVFIPIWYVQDYITSFFIALGAWSVPIGAFFYWRIRRRLEGVLRIWPDRLEITQGGKTRVLPFDGMEILECSPWPGNTALDLKTSDGGRYVSALWPSPAAEAIRDVAEPRITEGLRARLQRGESIVFREYRKRFIGRVIGLLLLVAWGAMGAMAVLRRDAEHAPAGLYVMFLAGLVGIPLLFRTLMQFRRGGVTISREGIQSRGALIPWADVERVSIDGDGLSIHTSSRKVNLASPSCANYRPLMDLVRECVPSLD